jgi:hypothetical protein
MSQRFLYSPINWSLAVIYLWFKRPVQMISSTTLMTGWTYALAHTELARPYTAFEWIPWPIAAIAYFLLGFGWIYVTIKTNEGVATKFLWLQVFVWMFTAAHFDPYTQSTAMSTYVLLCGGLIAQGLRTEKAVRYLLSQEAFASTLSPSDTDGDA